MHDTISPLVQAILASVPDTFETYFIAYSGGLDSTALLYASKQAFPNKQIIALHVNHELHENAEIFQEHCTSTAQHLDIPLQIYRAGLQRVDTNIEAKARDARYQYFERILTPSSCLLLAHHQQDQTETFLLRLMRGSGLAGLASIPMQRPIGKSLLYRPFLNTPQAYLRHFVITNSLPYIEDPTNQDDRFDRNYLRNQLLPSLTKRWPHAHQHIHQSADQLRLDLSALQDLLEIFSEHTLNRDTLPISLFASSPTSTHTWLLREWIKNCCGQYPPRSICQTITQQLRKDQSIHLTYKHGVIRKHKESLFFLKAIADDLPLPSTEDKNQSTNQSYTWHLDMPPPITGLHATRSKQGHNRLCCSVQQVEIRFRQAKVRCRPKGRQGSVSLKKLFQENNIPPWQREHIPLLWHKDVLACIPNIMVDESYAAKEGDDGWTISHEEA